MAGPEPALGLAWLDWLGCGLTGTRICVARRGCWKLSAEPPAVATMAPAVATAGVSDGGKAGISIGFTMLTRRAFATRRARAAAIKAGLRGPPSASSAPGVWEVLFC